MLSLNWMKNKTYTFFKCIGNDLFDWLLGDDLCKWVLTVIIVITSDAAWVTKSLPAVQCILLTGLEDRRQEELCLPSDNSSQTVIFLEYFEGWSVPLRNSSPSPEGYSPMTCVDLHKMVKHFSSEYMMGLYFDQLHLRKSP